MYIFENLNEKINLYQPENLSNRKKMYNFGSRFYGIQIFLPHNKFRNKI